jgi:hypothetical protein
LEAIPLRSLRNRIWFEIRTACTGRQAGLPDQPIDKDKDVEFLKGEKTESSVKFVHKV